MKNMHLVKIALWLIKTIQILNDAGKNILKGKVVLIETQEEADELRKLTQLVMHLEEKVQKRTKTLEEKNEQLYQLSFLDSLSGLVSGRHFDTVFQKNWEKSIEEQWIMALIIVDIDYFKKYNDTYGHQMGDHCLENICIVLGQLTHKNGVLAARTEGEFMILLENTMIKEVEKLTDKIRKSVWELKIIHCQSPYGYITVSLGVAVTIPQAKEKPTEFMLIADQALYLAQNKGKNRIERAVI